MPALANRSLPWSWPRAATGAASAALAAAVFAVLDVLDVLLCFVYGVVDGVLEENPVRCYCHRTAAATDQEEDDGVSDTLYVRRSGCREALTRIFGVVARRIFRSRSSPEEEPCKALSPRWSDCGCASCCAWRRTGADVGRLHYIVQDAHAAATTTAQSDQRATTTIPEDAIFMHGFGSSSSFWTETVFRESAALNHNRLIAVDLLGFGESPKPENCAYRLSDHVEAIERSVVEPLGLSSFHLVSHSMGCIVALALAAKHPERVKSITLVAPPTFSPCEEEKASQVALRRLAEKKLWPPMQFGSAVMSWYEHIGRTVCLLVCRNHRVWEWIFNLLTRKSGVHFVLKDLTRHTHRSSWHTMHNVICGGARVQERNVEAVAAAGVPVRLVHGDGDTVVPVECSHGLKSRLPRAELRLLCGRDHRTVVFGREEEFAQELGAFLSACQKSA